MATAAVIRKAILKAADQIEREPKTYNYDSVRKPDCDTPGCMWGWVGHFLGFEPVYGYSYLERVTRTVGFHYQDVCALGRAHGLDPLDIAPDAAKSLRLFADAHFPARKRKGRKSSHPSTSNQE